MITRRQLLKHGALATAAWLLPRTGATAAGKSERPNIVFILADDIGYGDLGCYGAKKVATPHADRLAAEGMRLTHGYAPAACCTPTRYGLLTGEYPWRKPGTGVLSGASPLIIEPGRPTLPALLKQAGYATAIVGKWHLGLGQDGPTDYNGELKPGPLEVGFDEFFGIPATGDRVPCVYVENHRVVGYDPADPIEISYGKPIAGEPTGRTHPERLKFQPQGGHDGAIVNGISRIGHMKGGTQARWVDEEIADTLTRKAVECIEKNQDRPFFLYFAPHDIHSPRAPHPRFRGTSQCGLYGDQIRQFDWSVGQVLAALDRLGLAGNTLVILSSDNGGEPKSGYRDGGVEGLNGHACNGALRGYKFSPYEGGVRVPLLARWPGRIAAGQRVDATVCLVDVLATCAELAGVPLPAAAGPDSFSFAPLLLGRADPAGRDSLVLQDSGQPGSLVVRRGAWKLIVHGADGTAASHKGKKQARPPGAVRPPELYNLEQDPAESRDLAEREPQKAGELLALLNKIVAAGRSRP